MNRIYPHMTGGPNLPPSFTFGPPQPPAPPTEPPSTEPPSKGRFGKLWLCLVGLVIFAAAFGLYHLVRSDDVLVEVDDSTAVDDDADDDADDGETDEVSPSTDDQDDGSRVAVDPDLNVNGVAPLTDLKINLPLRQSVWSLEGDRIMVVEGDRHESVAEPVVACTTITGQVIQDGREETQIVLLRPPTEIIDKGVSHVCSGSFKFVMNGMSITDCQVRLVRSSIDGGIDDIIGTDKSLMVKGLKVVVALNDGRNVRCEVNSSVGIYSQLQQDQPPESTSLLAGNDRLVKMAFRLNADNEIVVGNVKDVLDGQAKTRVLTCYAVVGAPVEADNKVRVELKRSHPNSVGIMETNHTCAGHFEVTSSMVDCPVETETEIADELAESTEDISCLDPDYELTCSVHIDSFEPAADEDKFITIIGDGDVDLENSLPINLAFEGNAAHCSAGVVGHVADSLQSVAGNDLPNEVSSSDIQLVEIGWMKVGDTLVVGSRTDVSRLETVATSSSNCFTVLEGSLQLVGNKVGVNLLKPMNGQANICSGFLEVELSEGDSSPKCSIHISRTTDTDPPTDNVIVSTVTPLTHRGQSLTLMADGVGSPISCLVDVSDDWYDQFN